MNVVKKHSQKIQSQFNTLQTEYESEKNSYTQIIESLNIKCTNAEQQYLEAQKRITDLELNIVLLKQENEKSLKEIQGNMLKILILLYEILIK